MAINPRFLIIPATAMLVVAALAGCAPATAPASAATSATPAAPSAAPSSAPAAAAAALTGLPTACPSAALVSSTLGISAPVPGESKDSTSLNCAYVGGPVADSLSINFSTARQLSPAAAEAALKAQGSTPAFAAVSGVGSFAFYDKVPGAGSYIAVGSGPVAFHIVVTGSESEQQLASLANAIITG
jgi:hypothetical protein